MQINKALTIAENILKENGINSSRIDAILLLCHCTDLTKEQIIFNSTAKISTKQEELFFQLINRRSNKEPVSHLIGKREFFGIDFAVNNFVLDPRPDSETLIELVLENFPNHKKKCHYEPTCGQGNSENIKILELGVGSGCLILTILKYFPNAAAVAVDTSFQALEVAQKNSLLLNLNQRISFIQSNWFGKLNQNDKFNLIISNPPYIKTSDIQNLQEEVKNFEPSTALDGGADGLNCYRQISSQVNNYLAQGGILIIEIGQNQEQDIVKIFSTAGLNFIQDKKDLAGIVRCLMFQLPNNS